MKAHEQDVASTLQEQQDKLAKKHKKTLCLLEKNEKDLTATKLACEKAVSFLRTSGTGDMEVLAFRGKPSAASFLQVAQSEQAQHERKKLARHVRRRVLQHGETAVKSPSPALTDSAADDEQQLADNSSPTDVDALQTDADPNARRFRQYQGASERLRGATNSLMQLMASESSASSGDQSARGFAKSQIRSLVALGHALDAAYSRASASDDGAGRDGADAAASLVQQEVGASGRGRDKDFKNVRGVVFCSLIGYIRVL